MISVKSYSTPEWDRREIMRYARIRGADETYGSLIDECIAEAEPTLSYRVCYTLLPVSRNGGVVSFGTIRTQSQTIMKAIRDSRQILLFAATVGAPFDALIRRYSLLSPSKALIMQAIGAERAESLCDAFCAKMTADPILGGKRLTTRVSPGYGDIPLSMQRDIFALLDCPRKIGLTLDESLLMSPSKSVTALCGVTDCDTVSTDKCAVCDKADCVYKA